MTSIFQLDWILIDTIIIFLLLVLLFSVKIFKFTHRWRNSFSNQALEHYSFSKMPKIAENHFDLIKKWNFTRNLSLKEKFSSCPPIILFGRRYKRKFSKILIEGLCSYGFTIINIKLNTKNFTESIKFEKNISTELKSLISAIIDSLKLKNMINNTNYIILNHSKPMLNNSLILSDPNNLGVLMINPKLNKRNFSAFYDLVKENTLRTQNYVIFSSRSVLILKNKHLKKFLTVIVPQRVKNLKYLTIEKATYSFKYYETIVLGMIIDIFDNKLLKSKNLV
ncbi:MAG: hypothetical protein ACFE9N_00665 [Promethearchaeota archaeon]